MLLVRRLKVLLSAYACEPGKGSEEGVGWNVAREIARFHDIWVLTRANNRSVIEAELARNPVPNLNFVYFDLPRWARWWKRGRREVQLYYYLWQIGAYFVALRLHREVTLDLVHHVTFVKYWAPSFLGRLPIPFLWGPVGGGESAPKSFWPSFGTRGFLYEGLREIARWLAEHDPFVLQTARRGTLVLATTQETATRLNRLGVGAVKVFSQLGLCEAELRMLSAVPPPPMTTIRFISVGNLLHFKGFHIGLAAFAQSRLSEAEYWIIGDGPERKRLERLAHNLGVAKQVFFLGKLPRTEVLNKLAECHVLVHPGLHDSGGWVCLEGMAAGRPVVCLDLGGPAVQVTEESGIKVTALLPEQTVRELATAMRRLAEDSDLRQRMGEAARRKVQNVFSWKGKIAAISDIYEEISRGD